MDRIQQSYLDTINNIDSNSLKIDELQQEALYIIRTLIGDNSLNIIIPIIDKLKYMSDNNILSMDGISIIDKDDYIFSMEKDDKIIYYKLDTTQDLFLNTLELESDSDILIIPIIDLKFVDDINKIELLQDKSSKLVSKIGMTGTSLINGHRLLSTRDVRVNYTDDLSLLIEQSNRCFESMTSIRKERLQELSSITKEETLKLMGPFKKDKSEQLVASIKRDRLTLDDMEFFNVLKIDTMQKVLDNLWSSSDFFIKKNIVSYDDGDKNTIKIDKKILTHENQNFKAVFNYETKTLSIHNLNNENIAIIQKDNGLDLDDLKYSFDLDYLRISMVSLKDNFDPNEAVFSKNSTLTLS